MRLKLYNYITVAAEEHHANLYKIVQQLIQEKDHFYVI